FMRYSSIFSHTSLLTITGGATLTKLVLVGSAHQHQTTLSPNAREARCCARTRRVLAHLPAPHPANRRAPFPAPGEQRSVPSQRLPHLFLAWILIQGHPLLALFGERTRQDDVPTSSENESARDPTVRSSQSLPTHSGGPYHNPCRATNYWRPTGARQ